MLVGAGDIASCTSDGDEGHGRIAEMRRDPLRHDGCGVRARTLETVEEEAADVTGLIPFGRIAGRGRSTRLA